MDSPLGPLTEPTVLPNRGSLSDLCSRVVFSGYLWNKLSIFGLFSLSETGVAYSSRSLRLFMDAGNYISILKSVKEKTKCAVENCRKSILDCSTNTA
jgi:hypothetical protein